MVSEEGKCGKSRLHWRREQIWCLFQRGAALSAPGLEGRNGVRPLSAVWQMYFYWPPSAADGLAHVVKHLAVKQA